MNPLENLEERVGMFLGQLGLTDAHQPNHVRLIKADGTTILVSCFEQDDNTWCRVAAIVLIHLEPSLEVVHRILQLNNNVLFGAFRLFGDRTLIFSATLHGPSLDLDGFEQTLHYAAHIAQTQGALLRPLAAAQSGAELMNEAAPCGS